MEYKLPLEAPISRLYQLAQHRNQAQLPTHLQALNSNTQQQASDHQFTSFLQNEYSVFAVEPGPGRSAIQMYVEVAVEALNAIEQFDPTVAKTVRQVIDFLVNCTYANPHGLDDALSNIEELTIKNDELDRQVSDLQFHEEFLKAENDALKDRLVVVEDMMTKYYMDNEKKESELREVKKRMMQLDEFLQQEKNNTYHNKTIRNAAVMRYNELSAYLMEQLSSIERLKIKIRNVEFKNKELSDQVMDYTIQLDYLKEQLNYEIQARKQLEARRKEYISDLEVENVKYKNRVDVLSEYLDKKDNAISSLYQQIKTLTFNLQQIKASLRNYNRLYDSSNRTFESTAGLSTTKRYRYHSFAIEDAEMRNAGVYVHFLRYKINPNFKFRVIDPETEDPEALGAMHLEDLSEDSDEDLYEEAEELYARYYEYHSNEEKSKKQQLWAQIEELNSYTPDFEEIVDPRETDKIRQFLRENCCTRAYLKRHVLLERVLVEKYRKYKFYYNMQAMELEYLQRQVKCEEIQHIILSLDYVLEKSLYNANGAITYGSEFERTLYYLEDMKKYLFGRLQQADEEDLKYMLLLTQARKLTTQIEENLVYSKPDNLSMITGVSNNQTLSNQTQVPLTDDFLHTIVKQITNVIGQTKRTPKKREQYVKFEDFCKEIQPDLIVRKQQHNIYSVTPKFNIASQVLGAKANASKAGNLASAQKPVIYYIEKPMIYVYEKIIEKVVEKIVEKPVFVDRPVYIDKIVEKPILQYVDRIVERFIEKPVAPTADYIERPKSMAVVARETVENCIYTDTVLRNEKSTDHYFNLPIIEALPQAIFIENSSYTENIYIMLDVGVQVKYAQYAMVLFQPETSDKAVQKEFVTAVESTNLESTAVQTEVVVSVIYQYGSYSSESSTTESESSSGVVYIQESKVQEKSVAGETVNTAVYVNMKAKTRSVGLYVQFYQVCYQCARYVRELAHLKIQPKNEAKSSEICPSVYQYQEASLAKIEYRAQGYIGEPQVQYTQYRVFDKVQANTNEFVDTLAHNFYDYSNGIVQGATKLMISKFIYDYSKYAVDEILTAEQKMRSFLESYIQFTYYYRSRRELEKPTLLTKSVAKIIAADSRLSSEKSEVETLPFTKEQHQQFLGRYPSVAALVEQSRESKAYYGEKLTAGKKQVHIVAQDSVAYLKRHSDPGDTALEEVYDDRYNAKSMIKKLNVYKSLRGTRRSDLNGNCGKNHNFVDILEETNDYDDEAQYLQSQKQAVLLKYALAPYQRKTLNGNTVHAEQSVTFANAAATIGIWYSYYSEEKELNRVLDEGRLRYNGQLIRIPHLETKEYTVQNGKFVSPYKKAIYFRKRYIYALKRNNLNIFKYLRQREQLNAKYAVFDAYLSITKEKAKISYSLSSGSEVRIADQIEFTLAKNYGLPSLICRRLVISQIKEEFLRDMQTNVREGDTVSWLFIPTTQQLFVQMLQEMKSQVRVKIGLRKNSRANLPLGADSQPYYVQLPENTVIKPLAWLLRFVRQSYYDIDHQYIYRLLNKARDLTGGQLIFCYIVEKVGLQQYAVRFAYYLLATLQFHLEHTLAENAECFTELALFALFIFSHLTTVELLFAKYCRSLFPLDSYNPAQQPLYQSACPHLFSEERILVAMSDVFKLNPTAESEFGQRHFCNADDAIFWCVQYEHKNRVRVEYIILQQFEALAVDGAMSLKVCLQSLSRLCETLTEERLLQLLEGRPITADIFLQLYQLMLERPADSLRRSIASKLENLDKIALNAGIVDDELEALREDVVFWFESAKMLRAKALVDEYERYVVARLHAYKQAEGAVRY